MTSVIINDILPREQFTATAGQTVFNTLYTADDETDIDVYARADGVAPDDESQLVDPSLYNVTFIGSTETVRVTFLSGRALGDIITIVRNTPSTRDNLYTNTNFVPEMLNQDFGILTLVDQQAQLYDELVAPHYNVSAPIDTPVDVILPILEENQIWAMAPSRTGIIAYDVPAGGGVAPKESKYLIQTADTELPNAQVMGSLATGFVYNTTSSGVQATRVFQGTANQLNIANGSGASGNPTYSIATNPTLPGTGYFFPPQGTTAERPGTPVDGMTRYNTDLKSLEVYESTAWDPLSGGVVDSVVGTANQIDVDSSTPSAPVLSFSATANFPGTFTIQGSTVLNGIISSNTFAGAAYTNINSALATQEYIDNQITPVYPVTATLEVATTAGLSATYANGTAGVGATFTAGANGAISIDGVTLNVNDLVLVKDQGTGDAGTNGIYSVTTTGDGSNPYVLTRSTSYDEVAEFVVGDAFAITSGTVNGGTEWVLTNAPTAINDDGSVANYIMYEENVPAEVSGYVNLIGNQDVYGIKTFNDPLIAPNQFGTDYLIVSDNPEDLGAATPALIVTMVAGDAVFITQTNVDLWFAPEGAIILGAATGNDVSVTTAGGGYFNINSTQGIEGIINDSTMATATARNTSTALAMKTYVDEKVSQFKFLNSAKVASTGNFASTYDNGTAGVGATLTASSNGAASIDGVALSLTDRVLFKDQTNTFENGIYVVSDAGSAGTPAVYTRSTDFDEPSEMTAGEIATVTEGTVNANTGWLLTSTVTTIGTDPITFVSFIPDVSNVVTLDGVQTITGDKTFSGTVDFGLTDGQLLIGDTGNPAAKATLTAGTGINIVNTAGDIEISTNPSTTGDALQLSVLLMGG